MKPPLPLVTECVAFHYEEKKPTESNHSAELHIHPFYQFDLFPAGGIQVRLEGRASIRTQPWTGLLIPPMVGHGYVIEKTSRQLSVKFYVDPRYWLQFRDVGKLIAYPQWYGDMLREAHDVFESDESSLRGQHLVSVITVCLSHWLNNQAPQRQEQRQRETGGGKLRAILELIAPSPAHPWTVSALARHCQMSPDLFCRQFHAMFGKTPRKFLLELRMRTAALRLLHEETAIKEVAREVGYATVHSFTRAFTEVFGTSPAAYVKTVPSDA